MSRLLDRIEREMTQPRRTPRQERIRRISVILLLLLIPLIGGELLLRLAGFYRPQIDYHTQQNLLKQAGQALNTRFNTDAFQYDPRLLWKLQPGKNLEGLTIDDRGLLSWQSSSAKTPRTVRPLTILCLGDSVTAVTYKTYPEITERLAAAGANSRPLQVWNAAVPGYSTAQALRRLQDLKDLQPDVVVFCFGWSDHFPALNLPDNDLGAANAITGRIHTLLKDVRLYQLIGSPLVASIQTGLPKNTEADPSDHSRVPLPQFRQNLVQLIATTRSWSAVPILVTQPENLPDSPTADSATTKALHLRYNQTIRDVAINEKTPLLDLEEEFVRRPREFMLQPDGIHLTGRGHNHVSRLILGALKNEGLITPGDYDAIAQAEKHDTTAPDKPKITWALLPDHVAAPAGQTFAFTAIPQNSGNTRWLTANVVPQFGLQKNVSYGSTSIFTQWRTINSPADDITSIPLRTSVLPGEATSMTLTMRAPDVPGNYELEVGLYCDQIGPLTAYGAQSTTLTVTSVQP